MNRLLVLVINYVEISIIPLQLVSTDIITTTTTLFHSFTIENVIKQLRYRYDCEIENCNRLLSSSPPPPPPPPHPLKSVTIDY